MTAVSFEAASIMDVISRAEKAAPKVSESTERFAGIVIDVQEPGNYVVVYTTNEKVYYREIVDPIGITGERAIWRVSAAYLSKVIATFKSNSGATIEFTQVGGTVEITQDRKKAKLGLMAFADYPRWYESEIGDAPTVRDLGAAMKLVEWATDSSVPALNGVRVTGEAVYATDRYVMARFPLEVAGLEAPITLEADLLPGLIDNRGDLKFKVVGGQAVLSPHEKIQIRTSIIGEKYPPIESAMRLDYPASFRVPRDEFASLIKTAMSMYPEDKSKVSLFRLFIGGNTVAGIMEHEDDPTSGVRDIIDVGGADHELHEICFNPRFIGSAISNAPDEAVWLKYDTTNPRAICLVESESGYQCWVTPIDPSKRKGSA